MLRDEFDFDIDECILEKCPFAKFKGGGGSPPSSTIADTEGRKYAREQLYPMVKRGMSGEGYGTDYTQGLQRKTLYGGLDDAYAGAQSDLKSTMSRTIDPSDTRVKNFLTSDLQRSYVTGKDNLSRSIRSQNVADVDLSMALSGEYLAAEKRMGLSGAQMYNQALQANMANQSRAGTFSSNITSGLGSGMASYYFAQKMGAG